MKPSAVIFEPLHASEGRTEFARQMTPLVEKHGFTVEILDTASLCDPSLATVQALADRWSHAYPDLSTASLLVGSALGGAVAHEILRTMSRDVPLISISAPSHATDRLDQLLEVVVSAATHFGAAAGARALDEVVGANSSEVGPLRADATRRFASGLGVLRGTQCPGGGGRRRHLAIYGARSTLVRRENACRCDAPTVVEIDGAGMRPLEAASNQVAAEVSQFLTSEPGK